MTRCLIYKTVLYIVGKHQHKHQILLASYTKRPLLNQIELDYGVAYLWIIWYCLQDTCHHLVLLLIELTTLMLVMYLKVVNLS